MFLTRKGMFSGVILLGFGLYFLLRHYQIQLIDGLYTWPTLLIIVGCGFLAQGYVSKEHEAILPGTVITGMGIHFHIVQKLDLLQDHAGVFLLLVSIGILLTYVKTGVGLFVGLLFLAGACLLLFFDRLSNWAIQQGHDITLFSKFWPLLFIGAGIYFLLAKKKK